MNMMVLRLHKSTKDVEMVFLIRINEGDPRLEVAQSRGEEREEGEILRPISFKIQKGLCDFLPQV